MGPIYAMAAPAPMEAAAQSDPRMARALCPPPGQHKAVPAHGHPLTSAVPIQRKRTCTLPLGVLLFAQPYF